LLLVLLRHGAAEKINETMTDRDRKLVDKGVKRTLRIASELLWILPKPVTLYSSPLTRTNETAEILSHTIGDLPIHLSDDLESGDYKTFLGSLDTDGTVIAVGHEPHLSNWLFELTDIKVDFKKSAFAIFEIKKEAIAFLTYVRYVDIERTLMDHSYFHSLAQIRELISQSWLDNPHTLHRYRVRLKHIETLLDHLKLADHEIYDEPLHQALKIQIQASEPLRELDASIERIAKDQILSESMKALFDALRTEQRAICDEALKTQPFVPDFQLRSFVLLNRYYGVKKRKSLIRKMFEHLLGQIDTLIDKMDHESIDEIYELSRLVKKVVFTADMELKTINDKYQKIIDFSRDFKELLDDFLDYVQDYNWLKQAISNHSDLQAEADQLLQLREQDAASLFHIYSILRRYGKLLAEAI
jgi:phosphohistidine phosphatase